MPKLLKFAPHIELAVVFGAMAEEGHAQHQKNIRYHHGLREKKVRDPREER